METQLFYDFDQKHLSFRLKEKLNTRYNIEAKGKGLFNTVQGALGFRVEARKIVAVGPSSLDGGTSPTYCGLGVAWLSGSRDPCLALTVRKRLALLDGPNTALGAKAEVDVDHTGNAIRRHASLKLSHKMPKFTTRQDLKVSVGLDVDWPMGTKRPTQNIRLQARENNWGLQLRRQRWSVTYDL